MIILYSPKDKFTKWEEFARIEDGTVVLGEFQPHPDVDLSDEESLLHRYNGPGVVAAKYDEDEVPEIDVDYDTRAEGTRATATSTNEGTCFRCTMCGTTRETEQIAREARRWMSCPDCQKNRFFEQTGGEHGTRVESE